MRIAARLLLILLSLSPVLDAQQLSARSWKGTLHDTTGAPIKGAEIHLIGGHGEMVAQTQADGSFQFPNPPPGSYQVTVVIAGVGHSYAQLIDLTPDSLPASVTIDEKGTVTVTFPGLPGAPIVKTTGGEQLSSQTVSAIPLNKRDFSQLLLLAAGTMTDANGATNFTQQFAINGQRGVEATFAMDNADTSDPEMGGATFSNFNVDAVEEIKSYSGWMPAEIGRGAAGFTNIITRSGSSGFHGSIFEFLRNSSLDARNYFDFATIADPGRIPPFRRNEFGFTNGGTVIIPHIYNGRGKTFYFGQYQGFRQVLGTTQVLPVPTQLERDGYDARAYPRRRRSSSIPIRRSPQSSPAIRYPTTPPAPTASNTYAASSKVVTNANQFSIRLDHQLSDKSQLMARFNFNNLFGPTTNPDQTAIDPAFGVTYVDHQRNGIVPTPAPSRRASPFKARSALPEPPRSFPPRTTPTPPSSSTTGSTRDSTPLADRSCPPMAISSRANKTSPSSPGSTPSRPAAKSG